MALANPTLRIQIQNLKSKIQNLIAERYAVATLAMSGGMSALIYWLMFVRPFDLLRLANRPLLDLFRFSRDDPQVLVKLIAAFLVQGALYWLAWRAARRARGRAAWIIVLGSAILFGVLFLFMYPHDAADIFDNVMHGRMISVYGANPFLEPAAHYWRDPFYSYTAWRASVSAYGPGWEVLAALTTRLAGNSVIANVLAFKLLLALFLAGSVVVVTAMLRRIDPTRALAGVVLLAWNPVILYETIGNGHNDMAMIFWVLLAAWLLLNRRYTLTMLSIIVGALFKYIPLLMLPAAGLIALRDLDHTRARLRFLALTAIAALALIVVAYTPFWHGVDTLSIGRRTHLFTTSLPATIYVSLMSALGKDAAGNMVSVIASGLTVLFAVVQGWRAYRERSALSFTRSAFYILMFYLLFTCLWFQQWYAVWPLGLAALLPPGHAARSAALFGYTAQSKALIFSPLFLWVRPLPPASVIDRLFGPLVMSAAWAYVLFAIWITWRTKRRDVPAERLYTPGET